MSTVEKFKFWANKILPLVYDDSLSYYEFLCKVHEKLNETIDAVNDNTAAIAEFDQRITQFMHDEQLARQNWESAEALKWAAFKAMFINEYDPDDSYVRGDICSHGMKMYVANAATTGTFDPAKWDEIVLSDYLAEYVADAKSDMQDQYDDFLEDYQRQFGVKQTVGSSTTDVVSQLGISQILNMLNNDKNLINWTEVVNETRISRTSGQEVTDSDYVSTPFIAVGTYTALHNANGYCVAWYDSTYTFISASTVSQAVNTVPENAAYFRASIANAYVGSAVICDEAEWKKGLTTRLPLYSDKTFRATTNLATAGYTLVSDITIDGVYNYMASESPADLPDIMSGKAGTIISIGIGETARLNLAISYTSNDQLMYVRSSGDTTWRRLNKGMIRTTAVQLTDFNQLTTAGQTYYFTAGDISGVANKPFSDNGIIMVEAQNDRVAQIAISKAMGAGKKTIAIRGKTGGDAWDTWYTIENTENVFHSTTNLTTAGYTLVSDIDTDGIYSFPASASPADLPAILSNKPGTIISIGIGESTRLNIVVSYTTTEQLAYVKSSADSTWRLLNQGMLRLSVLNATDFNEVVTPGQTYFFSGSDTANMANKPFGGNGILIVEAQNNFVTQIAISNAIADGTKKVAIRGKSTAAGWGTWFTFENGDNPYRGKTINWLGDSIVAGDEFDEIVAAHFGMNLNDYGSPGARIAYKPNTSQTCLSVSYLDMTDNCDIIAVSGGTNDFENAWTPFGTVHDTTNDTFYGALNVLCLGLINKYPDKPIFFTTPIKRASREGQDVDWLNDIGKTMLDYCNAIKEVCSRYSIPVLDLYAESQMNPAIPAQRALLFNSDGIHPNANGAAVMARRTIGWMKQLM